MVHSPPSLNDAESGTLELLIATVAAQPDRDVAMSDRACE
jgi:hypothetical protein